MNSWLIILHFCANYCNFVIFTHIYIYNYLRCPIERIWFRKQYHSVYHSIGCTFERTHILSSYTPLSPAAAHILVLYIRAACGKLFNRPLYSAHILRIQFHTMQNTHTHTLLKKNHRTRAHRKLFSVLAFSSFFFVHTSPKMVYPFMFYINTVIYSNIYKSHCVCTKVWPIVAAAATPFNILSFGISLLVCMRGARQVFSWL